MTLRSNLRIGMASVFLMVVVSLVMTSAARAHSVLLRTEPATDSVVAESPEQVSLHFDEPVESALGSIRVYNGAGERVDDDETVRPEPESVAVGIDGTLERGTYTATWRVISADSDPISGAFVFHVGAPGAEPGGIAGEIDEGSGLVSFLFPSARFLDYIFLLLCAGGALILVVVLPMAGPGVRRTLYRALGVTAVALALSSLAAFALQGAQAGGLGLGEALGWDVLSAVAGTRYGEMSLLRAGLALAFAVTAFVLSRRDGGLLGGILCVGLAAVMLLTPVASGHASVAGPLAFASDYAHILAAAAWTGGLAVLVGGLLLADGDRWSLAARSVPRFSNLAVAAVGILIVAGTINAYLQVRALRGLWDTEYGLLLMAKVALVVPLLGLGAFNNRYAVPKLRAGTASPPERRRFLRAVGAELAVMTVIVAVTAVLVNAAPAYKLVAFHTGPVAMPVELGPYEAHVTVDPAEPGRNRVAIEFEDDDRPDEVLVFATLASEAIGPLRYVARVDEEGMFVVPEAELSIPGEWELRIEARKGEFDLYAETIPVMVGGEME